jgi:ubiquinone/menaquinone biosynthesis C-methylase UbiE
MVKLFPDPGVRMDLQALGMAGDAIDSIFCLHVLEHVADARKSIRELFRVLKPGGVAYVMVPLMMGWPETVEFGAPDPNIFDHVRGYSINDFKERLAPFEYEEIMPKSFLAPEELRRYRIPWNSQVIYRCNKRGQ